LNANSWLNTPAARFREAAFLQIERFRGAFQRPSVINKQTLSVSATYPKFHSACLSTTAMPPRI